jgi:hypothetical protein
MHRFGIPLEAGRMNSPLVQSLRGHVEEVSDSKPRIRPQGFMKQLRTNGIWVIVTSNLL